MKIFNKIKTKIYNFFHSNETIKNSQSKWNTLARKNAKYYVLSLKKQAVTEEDIDQTGKRDYADLIEADNFLKETLSPFSSKAVLEIGCGVGRITKFFALNFKEVHALDISEEMIHQAKARIYDTYVNWIVGDGLNYHLADNKFDFVFSYIVFQHMPDKKTVKKNLQEIVRVLKNKGIAKVHLGGVLMKKNLWAYGAAFTKSEIIDIFDGLEQIKLVSLIGKEDDYYWVTFQKI